MSTSSVVCTVGIPRDLGQSRRGVDMGPSAVRYVGLGKRLTDLGYAEERFGNLEILDRDVLPPEGGLAFLETAVETCGRIYETAREATRRGSLPCSRVATILSLSERSREWPPMSPWACCRSTPTPI